MILVLLAAILVAQTVPVQLPPVASTADPSDLTWQWLRTEYGDDSVVTAPDPTRYTLVLRRDGTYALRADCNQVVGDFTRQGSQLTIRPGVSTLVACPPGSESVRFVRDLESVGTFVYRGDDTLVMNLRADSGNMVFERVNPLSLTDVTWRVQSYNNGRGGVTTPLQGTSLTATFAPDGSVSGSAGCNTYRGAFTTENDALSIGPLATTRMACPEPILEQEGQFLAALEATSQFAIQADQRLTLRDADGSIQAVFVAS
jgi:heat shock protein HslJ